MGFRGSAAEALALSWKRTYVERTRKAGPADPENDREMSSSCSANSTVQPAQRNEGTSAGRYSRIGRFVLDIR